MTIVFTICSNNYLAQAKTLMDSVHKHNPEYKLVIGLVDKLSEQIDYNFFSPAEIIPVENIGIDNFEELTQKYDIIELNTAAKPSFFKYLIKSKEVSAICYLDPDIKVYDSLNLLDIKLINNDILLTPHIFTQIPDDDNNPQEWLFLKHGLYNLGFLMINPKSENSIKFIDWWQRRCFIYGFYKPEQGLFVDQKWIDLVPILFEKVHLVQEKGCNMAPWNLHERTITQFNDEILLGDKSNLLFFHFSSYDFKTPSIFAKSIFNRFSFSNRPDLIPLYQDYHKNLIKNKIEYYSNFKCELLPEKKEYTHESKYRILKNIMPPFLFRLGSYIKRNYLMI